MLYITIQLNFFLTVLPPFCILCSIKKYGGRTTHSNQHSKEEACSGDEEMRLTLLQKLLAWDCTRQRNWRISQQLFLFLGAERFIFYCESAWIRATVHRPRWWYLNWDGEFGQMSCQGFSQEELTNDSKSYSYSCEIWLLRTTRPD